MLKYIVFFRFGEIYNTCLDCMQDVVFFLFFVSFFHPWSTAHKHISLERVYIDKTKLTNNYTEALCFFFSNSRKVYQKKKQLGVNDFNGNFISIYMEPSSEWNNAAMC